MIAPLKNNIWRSACWLIVFLLITPVLVMVLASFGSSSDLFYHLWQTVLPDYITNTLVLGVLVVFLSLIFGTLSAAFIVHTNVLGKNFL